MIRFTGLVLAVLLIPLSFASGLTAQSGQDIEKKVHAAKVRIHELLEHAKSLDKKGWETKAEEIRKQAGNLKRELHNWLNKMEKKQAGKRKHQKGSESSKGREKILAGLLAGAHSLRELGRIDQAEMLERVAKDLARDLERHSAKGNKREVAKRHLRFLRIAVETLVEADKHKAAGRIEHFMHAMELGLENQRDRKAQKIRKSAPKPKQILNDLELAVRILREKRQKEKAAAVLETLRHLAESVRSHGKADDDDDEDDEDDEDEDDEDENEERIEERIEELEQRLQKMERYLKELTKVLKELKRRD